MNDNTIALTSIGGVPASCGEPPQVITIEDVPDHGVHVKGTVTCHDHRVACSLTRLRWSQTLFAVPNKHRHWEVTFDAVEPGTYLVSCCAEGEGFACAELMVRGHKERAAITIDRIDPPFHVYGTVTYPNNMVLVGYKPTNSQGEPTQKTCVPADSSKNWDFDFTTLSGLAHGTTYDVMAFAACEGSAYYLGFQYS